LIAVDDAVVEFQPSSQTRVAPNDGVTERDVGIKHRATPDPDRTHELRAGTNHRAPSQVDGTAGLHATQVDTDVDSRAHAVGDLHPGLDPVLNVSPERGCREV